MQKAECHHGHRPAGRDPSLASYRPRIRKSSLFCSSTWWTPPPWLDAESFRALMGTTSRRPTRWSPATGCVEKFIGDAVMAVFDIPKLHEDNALRAVTAAVPSSKSCSNLAAKRSLPEVTPVRRTPCCASSAA